MNTFQITILDNGNVRVETGKFSSTVHTTADAALAWIIGQLGGDVERQKTGHAHTHVHGHEHAHDHDHIAA